MRGTQDLEFERAFGALTGGRRPFYWQTRLYRRLIGGEVPPRCTLPTGLGKTSVIPLWLIALAHSGGIAPCLPRRLVYVVNRRTVVDQATDDAERLLNLLAHPNEAGEHEGTICRLRDALHRIAGDTAHVPLAVSTLRGELADNGDWKRNPACPAIVVGTIDMIGSKLLFSGYGDGRYGRAHHAGLVGQDALIVHDEAHLSPAFSVLLRSVEREQRRDHSGGAPATTRPILVMELSATTRGRPSEDAAFGLEPEDDRDPIVTQRRTARKTLSFLPCEGGKGELAKAIWARALAYRDTAARVLVYVRSPEDAKAVVDAFKSTKAVLGEGAEDRVCLLTGTLRGHERDRMAKESLVFLGFLSKKAWTPAAQTVYLVSTSAGEVGVDFDADHIVCDLTTLDSMAQRLGRVNRLGGKGRSAEITVIRERVKTDPERAGKRAKEPGRYEAAVALTGDILGAVAKAGGDVSPNALATVLQAAAAEDAFSPTPTILPATDILFDSWALTSILGDLPGRPEVGPYLHGVAEWEPPETSVAWRAEIGELAMAGASDDDLEAMLEAFPIRAAERLKDATGRVMDHLAFIAERHPGARAVLIKNGEPRWVELSAVAATDKNDKPRLNEARRLLSFATVLLPCEVGGLRHGMLDGETPTPVEDVAEVSAAGQRDRQRVRVKGDEESPLLHPDGEPTLPDRCTRCALAIGEPATEDGAAPRPTIEYRVARAESGEPGRPVLLSDHSAAVEAAARQLGDAIGLPPDLAEALVLAGRWHDKGKDRARWQDYAHNPLSKDASRALAKSSRYRHWRLLGGYRHEFGSLIDAAAARGVTSHPERELILHLIASHHGWARPHFRHDGARDGVSAYDPSRLAEGPSAAADAMRRYATLQRRFGRWGLAWLESLLRAADVAASEGGAG
ncbi:MAG: type I-U CRISPR-associated helicase/endonuclease Cas3 [Phycisphaerales bacterium]|nr:type I-U CRISPR-associated helicase/endonuclease Cas3 [Phycisphaerales bacterium]